jgi:hypothetical protein
MRVLAAVVFSFALAACSGSDEAPSVDPASGAAPFADHDVRTSVDAGAAKKDAGASTPTNDAGATPPTSKPDAGSPGPTKPPPRVDINSLSGADQQRIFDAITGFVRSATISVKVANQQVVTWEETGTLTPVSVVRAHHAIHHGGDRFFTCHRWYLQTMEKAIAASLPNGRLPAWNPSTPMPTPFRTLARPTKGGDCETMGSLTRTDFFGNVCEFAWTSSYTNVNDDYVTIQGLENTDPGVAFPAKYLPGNICTFATATALANDIGAGFTNSTGYHNLVHNTIGGTMQTMDAPEAAIFWPWHATIDQIFQNWLDCGKPPPPVCF